MNMMGLWTEAVPVVVHFVNNYGFAQNMRFSRAELAIFSFFHGLHKWYNVDIFLNWLNGF